MCLGEVKRIEHHFSYKEQIEAFHLNIIGFRCFKPFGLTWLFRREQGFHCFSRGMDIVMPCGGWKFMAVSYTSAKKQGRLFSVSLVKMSWRRRRRRIATITTASIDQAFEKSKQTFEESLCHFWQKISIQETKSSKKRIFSNIQGPRCEHLLNFHKSSVRRVVFHNLRCCCRTFALSWSFGLSEQSNRLCLSRNRKMQINFFST